MASSSLQTMLADSKNGQPIVTDLSELFVNFPYENLPTNYFLRLFFQPESVCAMITFYVFSKPLFKKLAKNIDPKGYSLRTFVAVHNLSLAIFSGLVCANTTRLVINHVMNDGFLSAYCGAESKLWSEGLGSMAVLFYISKFYEFMDTWILIFKGKKPSFLQVYHHTGVAFIMWAAVASQACWLFAPVILNCFIHTLMYTYFFIKTISPETQIKSAKYLTMAQIGQFWTGIFLASGVLYLGEPCASQSSRFSLLMLMIYGFGLISLFSAFASKKYKTKKIN